MFRITTCCLERQGALRYATRQKYSADVVKTPTLQLNSALGLLHQKSEEIAELKMHISDGEDERRALLGRIALLEADNKVVQRERMSPSGPAIESQDNGTAALQASLDESKSREMTPKRMLRASKIFTHKPHPTLTDYGRKTQTCALG